MAASKASFAGLANQNSRAVWAAVGRATIFWCANHAAPTKIAGSGVSTKVAGSKLILVLGHSQCGAVRGAIDGVKMGNLTETLSHIMPAVEAVRRLEGSEKENPAEFLQRVAEVNVDLNVKKLTDQSEILRGLVAAGDLQIKGGMYSVETGRVTFRE